MLRWHRRTSWRERDHWALDLETTGLDPRRDEILSAGMVPIRGGAIRWGERRYRRLRPAGGGASEAVTVHGLLPDQTEGAIDLPHLVADLEERLRDTILVLHWSPFDLRILRRAFRQTGTRWPRPKVIDTTNLLRKLDRRRSLVEPYAKPTPHPLAQARATLGLPPHQEHHALYDALATAELYLALRARLG